MNDIPAASVVAVSSCAHHDLSKQNRSEIRLLTGLGIEGDAHMGATVRHRSQARRTPERPNLRQVHLIHAELFEELGRQGFTIAPGEMGENITTRGIDLLALPRGTRLRLGDTAVVELTGLRDPCLLLEKLQRGLMKAVLPKGPDGSHVRKSGVMSIVIAGGGLKPGDPVIAELPPQPHEPLEVV